MSKEVLTTSVPGTIEQYYNAAHDHLGGVPSILDEVQQSLDSQADKKGLKITRVTFLFSDGQIKGIAYAE